MSPARGVTPVTAPQQKEGGAVHINVQLDDHDTPPSVVTKHWIAMERAAGKIGGVVLSLEVHRDSCGPTLTTVDAVRWSAAPQRKPAISLRLRFTPAS